MSYLPLLSTSTLAEMASLALCSPVQAGCVRVLVFACSWAPPCFSTVGGAILCRCPRPGSGRSSGDLLKPSALSDVFALIDDRKSHTPSWEKLAEMGVVAMVFFLFL